MSNPSRVKSYLGILAVLAVLLPAAAQDEMPTKVTDQNRSGELPFSTTVGTDVEKVMIAGGNLMVNIPIVSVPGRSMPFSFGIRYDARFLQTVLRTVPTNHQKWNVERRTYITSDGIWAVSQPGFSYTEYWSDYCYSSPEPGENGSIAGTRNYIYHDASGGKHPMSAEKETGVCFFLGGFPWDYTSVGPDLTGDGDWTDTNSVWMADGTLLSAGGVNGSGGIPPPPGATYTDYFLGYGAYKDSNGNIKGEFAGGLDTLGRSLVTQVNGTNYIEYKVKDSGGTERIYTVNHAPITFATAFGVSGPYGAISEYGGTRKKVTSIALPNGRSYSFQYDSYGSLTEITLPTGAVITYGWANYQNGECTYRHVSSRMVTVDGQNHTWTFAHAPVGTKTCNANQTNSPVQVTMTDPAGNQSVYVVEKGNIQSAKFYTGTASGTPLREHTITYQNLSTDPRGEVFLPTEIRTTLENGQVSKKEFTYDTFNYSFTTCNQSYIACDMAGPGTFNYTSSRSNVKEIREFDWGSGSPGPLLRRTKKEYLHEANSAYLPKNIVGKVITSTIYDSTSNTCKTLSEPCAKTEYEYDQYVATGPDANPMQSPTGATQHDTAFNTSYTLRGNVTRLKRWRNTDSAMLTTTYTYDIFGNIRAIRDPLGHTTSFLYDNSFANSACPSSATTPHAWVSQVTNHLGHRTQVVRFPCTGLVQAHKNENDIVAARAGTTFTYDLMNRLLQKDFPDGGQESFNHNGDPVPPVITTTRKISTTPLLNMVSTTNFDGLGREKQTQLIDPDCTAGPVKVDISYDSFGRKASESNPYCTGETIHLTKFTYDALGRAMLVTPTDGTLNLGPPPSCTNCTRISYDGNTVTVIDPAGKKRKTRSDALERLITVWEPNAAGTFIYETVYQYDALDNLTRVDQKGNDPTPANWRTRTFTYNSLSELLSASNPESGTINYQYTNDGDLSAKIAPAPNQTSSATVTTTYDYDGLHRLKEKSYSDGTTPAVKFWYDGTAPSGCTPPTLTPVTNLIGNRTAMCDAAGGAAWSYDEMGRAKAVKQTILSVTKTISYEYNKAGLPTKITYPSGRIIDYEYNAAARAVVAKDVVNLVNYAKNATYTSHGALKTVLLGNDWGNAGTTFTQAFNKRLQPLTIHAANSSRTIINLTYSFNLDIANNGNVVSITNNLETGRSRSFTYDELNRVLTAATPPGTGAWSQSFEYDIWGNLKTITATGAPGLCVSVHPNNRLDSTCGGLTTYGHDSAGNLISEGTTTYTYNAENNLKTGGGVTFTYDGDGQRVSKSGQRKYWWGMNGSTGLLAETWPDGTDKREYIFFAGRRIAVVDLSVSGGNCAGAPPNCGRYYFYPDHLGSTSVLASTSGGTTVHEADFHPFGGEKVITSSSINPHYRFTGKERDGETGFDYFGARHYVNSLGRWMSPDWAMIPTPVPYADFSDPQTLNLYGYVRNSPTILVDDDGHGFWKKLKNFLSGGGWNEDAEAQKVRHARAVRVARFYAAQWAKENPHRGFDPGQYTDEQILMLHRSGAFSKTVDDAMDPLQMIGLVSVFRGGASLQVRSIDVKVDPKTGLVQPGRGVSVNSDPAAVSKFGGAYRVESVPPQLQVVQRGANPSHYEIVPREPMTLQRYQELLNQVKLTPVK